MVEIFTKPEDIVKITQLMRTTGTVIRKDLWDYDFHTGLLCEEVYERYGSLYTFCLDIFGSVECIVLEPVPKKRA
jgi:hypothetical protein